MLLSVRIPPTAVKLRRIINLAQIAQSHALSFFYLSSPDLLLGMDADISERSLVGVARAHPTMARNGIRLRQIGQQIIEMLGGKRIHPGWVVAGGVNKPLSKQHHDQILAMLPEAIKIADSMVSWFNSQLERFTEEISVFANFSSLYMALVGDNNELETYDGWLRLVDDKGQAIVDRLSPEKYETIIAEEITRHSYLKSPYYKPLGYPDGMYRVGPLARLHIASHCGTELADKALTIFRELDHKSSFYYHYARLIEIVYAFERIEQLLNEPDILDEHVRAFAEPNAYEGFGVAEAPTWYLNASLSYRYRWFDYIL